MILRVAVKFGGAGFAAACDSFNSFADFSVETLADSVFLLHSIFGDGLIMFHVFAEFIKTSITTYQYHISQNNPFAFNGFHARNFLAHCSLLNLCLIVSLFLFD